MSKNDKGRNYIYYKKNIHNCKNRGGLRKKMEKSENQRIGYYACQ